MASWTNEAMKQAMKECKEGASVRSVSIKYGIPRITLYRHVKSGSEIKKLGRFKSVFSKMQETDLCAYLKEMDSLFYGLSRKEFKCLVYEYAKKNKIPYPLSWNKFSSAGDDWLMSFQTRNPEIVLRTPEPTSVARVREFNKTQVTRFYKLLEEQLEKHQIGPESLYNMDETGIMTTTNKPPKVLSISGKKKQVGVISSTERGKLTTVICCCNATGSFVPPFISFARKRMQERLLDGAPPGTQAACTANGWTNGETFFQWLKIFIEHVRPSTNKRVVLILDNHESHKFFPALDYASQHHVTFVSFPPHTTHKLQPLDVAVYGPLKKYFEQEVNTFQKQHPGRIINQYDVAKLFREAYLKGASPRNAVSGFASSGIWPYNPNLFGEEDFAPSNTMDAALNINVPSSAMVTIPEQNSLGDLEANKENAISTLEAVAGPSNTKSYQPADSWSSSDDEPLSSKRSRQQLHCRHVTPIKVTLTCSSNIARTVPPPNFQGECEMTTYYSPSVIRPLPAPCPKKCIRKRKTGKAEVLTSTPIKLEQRAKLKESKIKMPKLPKEFTTKKKQKDKQQYNCLICDELYQEVKGHPIEDWIQCSGCHLWSHEACTSYGGTGPYKCHECSKADK